MIKHLFQTAALLATLLILPACGFRPLYADNNGNLDAQLSKINFEVLKDPARASYALENALADFLSEAGEVRYDLVVELKERRYSTAVTSLANTIRYNYELDAKYTLKDRVTGLTYQDTVDTISSYGVVVSQYSSQVGQEEAVDKAAQEIAQKIKLELILFLRDPDKIKTVSEQ